MRAIVDGDMNYWIYTMMDFAVGGGILVLRLSDAVPLDFQNPRFRVLVWAVRVKDF